MRNKTISISSDSSHEDDIPLKIIKIKKNGCVGDPNSYDSLCQRSLEACDFCDRISNNRYSSLIHNVTHIIIPLLNQKIFQCPTCLHSFTSERDLRSHTMKKHPEVTVAHIPLVNDNYSKRKTSQTSTYSYTKESQIRNSIEESNMISLGTKKRDMNIKNRLVFEDDDLIFLDCTSDRLLSDLTTDCKVNLEVFNTPWMNGERDEFSGKSVHYDELVKPGVFRCKRCGKGFPIRYEAIIHESSHITFKNSQLSLCVICKKYIVGGKNDLRHHYLTFHSGNIEKNHHPELQYIPKLVFEENNEEKKIYNSETLSLCDLCLSFCKNTMSKNYECIKTISKLGKRYECGKCKQLFFEINLVKHSWQRRTYTQKKRKKTNEDRLKTITNRFKMMKH